jgi:hypothetical protein
MRILEDGSRRELCESGQRKINGMFASKRYTQGYDYLFMERACMSHSGEGSVPVLLDCCSRASSSSLSFCSLTTFLFFTKTRTVRSCSILLSSCQFCIRDKVFFHVSMSYERNRTINVLRRY